MRHWKHGFQTNLKNDVYRIEEQLQEYDPHLYLMWNPKTNEHLIVDGLLDIAVMKIPQIGFEYLDSRVVRHIKKIHTANGFKATTHLRENEDRKEREHQRKIDDLAHSFAKDVKKHVKELAYQ